MRALLLSLALVALAGCDTDPIVPGEPLSRGQVEAAQAEFVAAGASAYTLQYQIECFCPPNTVEVRVVEGRVVDAEWTGYEVEPLTVLDLYDVVLDAFDEGAARVRVTVSEARPRVPAEIYIDYDEALADEEIGYRVVAFRAD